MREQCPSHAVPDSRSPFHRCLPQMEIEEQSTRRKKNSHHYIVCGVVRLAPYDICWFAMDLRKVQLEFRVVAIFFCASGWTTITRLPTKNLAIVWRTHTSTWASKRLRERNEWGKKKRRTLPDWWTKRWEGPANNYFHFWHYELWIVLINRASNVIPTFFCCQFDESFSRPALPLSLTVMLAQTKGSHFQTPEASFPTYTHFVIIV